ncbi:ABC transporter substrate-binding protein [Pseudomonas fluorescens]|jgi:L-cystine transport system substrate-binding protein|uniref:transporter substrate-binding domain-containing protein n=1 Tax=Pseudomonas TaxID=286 RepID=UPI0007CF23A8|nr:MULTISPECIES: transporter substrate-binding domain-containing protein [Pseudomonas]AYG10404.1 ABC transporter substrate-binding protein [Pseudomonas fluorescens]OAE16004.1 ABC transporter substrate-binding protein [Pseudomonas brenneri]MBJ2238865.1 transporter substrate-binding domain-containing protein [Pseudomonas sp. MF6768]MBJ2250001.1 transporter substrate-binding domain-containing protein [Pseudomonas sp. MF6784]MCM8559276.1 transporter substrate-binding domain-containing protein [Pse
MRFLPGLLLVLPLLSPLAHAELFDDVFDRGELRIALEADTPPFNFKEGDKLTGFEVELGELLAREMDVRASFITTDDSDLLPGVESGKYDVAINHIAVTPELQDRFDFSAPYSYSSASLIAHKQQKPLLGSLDALKSSQFIAKAQPAEGVDLRRPVNANATLTLAIPFQKGNPAFKSSLDKALERIKADGRLTALSEKWFEADTSKPTQ